MRTYRFNRKSWAASCTKCGRRHQGAISCEAARLAAEKALAALAALKSTAAKEGGEL